MSVTEVQPEVTEVPDELELIPTLPSEPATRRDVLLRAAELAEDYGYTSAKLGSYEEGFCFLGAVAAAGVELGYEFSLSYVWAGHMIGLSNYAEGYVWSDGLQYRGPKRVGLLRSLQYPAPPEEVIATTLRRLANGTPWPEATKA